MWTSTIKDKQLQGGVLRVVVTFTSDIEGVEAYDKTFELTRSDMDEKWLLNACADEVTKLSAFDVTNTKLVKDDILDVAIVISERIALAESVKNIIPSNVVPQ